MPHHSRPVHVVSQTSLRVDGEGVQFIDSGGRLAPLDAGPADLATGWEASKSLVHQHGLALGIAAILLAGCGALGGTMLVLMLGLPLGFLLPPALLALAVMAAGVWLIRSRRPEPLPIAPLLELARRQGGRIHVLEAAVVLRRSPRETEELLDQLARQSWLEVEIDERGSLVYRIPGERH